MTVVVTLKIYSGFPNPAWELTKSQAAKLKELFPKEEPRTTLSSPEGEHKLGYRGFKLFTSDEPDLHRNISCFNGIIGTGESYSPTFIDANSTIENFLLETAGKSIKSHIYDLVKTEIQKNLKSGAAGNLMVAPPFNPGKWNIDPYIQANNNCYNYGCDIITNTFAQPGRGSGQIGPNPPTCKGTGEVAIRDSLISVISPTPPFTEGHYVALVIWPGEDFHWYRLDSNGKWSHKLADDPAKDTDESDNKIDSPETCNRGVYTQFCGYFKCIPSQMTIY